MSTASEALRAAHEVLVDLVLDGEQRRAWTADPAGYARRRLPSGPALDMVGSLSAADVALAADNMTGKAADHAEKDRRADERRSGRSAGSIQPKPRQASARPLAARPPALPAVGCALRPPLLGALFGHLDLIEVWEHTADWYLGDDRGERGAQRLRAYAVTAPVAIHSLGLSVGSHSCLDDVDRIVAIRRIAQAAEVGHVSDHLALASVGGRRLPHFLPLWRVEEQLDLVVRNVAALQERMGVRILLENPAAVVDPGGDMSTAAFLNEVARRTGCGVLLDLENLRVNHENGHLDVDAELAELDLLNVVEVHVAGGTVRTPTMPAADTHDQPVRHEVFVLLESLLPQLANCQHVVLERDDRLDERDELVADVAMLHSIVARGRDAASPGLTPGS